MKSFQNLKIKQGDETDSSLLRETGNSTIVSNPSKECNKRRNRKKALKESCNSDDFKMLQDEKSKKEQKQESSIQLKPFNLTKSIKDNPIRLSEIVKILNRIYKGDEHFPRNDLVQSSSIIESYEYTGKSLFSLYKPIISKLRKRGASKKDLKALNIKNDDFPKKLAKIIESCNFLDYDLFWYDLLRFFFKLILEKRQKTNMNSSKFGKMIENYIRPIVHLSFNHKFLHCLYQIEFNMNFNRFLKPDQFSDLIVAELFENPLTIDQFFLISHQFYSDFDKARKEGRELVIDNDQFKTNYLGIKDFDQAILLKYLIIEYDHRSEMKKFILDPKHILTFPLKIDGSIELESDNYEPFTGLSDIEFENMSFLSLDIIEYHLDNGKKFKIRNYYSLNRLLKRLREMGILRLDTCKALIGFVTFEGDFEWSSVEFINYLKEYRFDGKKEYNIVDPNRKFDYDEFRKLIPKEEYQEIHSKLEKSKEIDFN